jgi:hypothetical protein
MAIMYGNMENMEEITVALGTNKWAMSPTLPNNDD